jgi:GNAT superfamily N-acetyltransferase
MATTATEEPTISQGGKISTFDKISGAQASLNSSTATNMFKAYNSGQMTPDDAQAYEAHVKAGEIMLPRGETLKGEAAGETAAPTAQGAARELPMSVWKAYGSNAMSPEDRISLERHVKLGHVAPPVDFVMDQTEMPETTLGGIGSAIARGVAPALPMAAAGAGIGAALGAPIAGVGAIPGAAAGALVGAGTSLLADPLTEAFNKLTGGHVGMPTEAIQQLLSHFGVQVPDTAVEHVMQSMAGGAVAGVSGAGAAKVIGGALGMAPMALNAASKLNKVAPTLTRFAAEMAEAPVAQAIAGAGAGGSAQIAAESGAGPGMQLAAGLLGGAATGVASTMHLTGPNAADLAGRQLAAEGKQFKIPVLTSDVSPPRTFVGKNLQAAGERVPITGTGPLRAAQQEARINAVREFVQEHGGASAAEAVEEVTANLLATHGEKLNKYNGKKLEVINRLSTNAAVPTPNAIAEIDKQINFLSSLKLKEFNPAIAILEDWKQASQGQNLSNIEVLRKQIGNVFQAPELASVRDTSSKALSSIYHAINEDMGEFILANGEQRDFAKWKIANLRLAKLKGEVDDKSVLEQILNKGEATPELVRKMLFSTKPSDVRVLYSKLSRQGKTSAQSAIIAEAAEKATTDGVIIPDRFSSGVDKLSSQFGVFFPGDAKRKVDGLVSVLRATKRAGAAAAHPPTGVQVATVGSALAAGHIVGTPLGGVSLLGSAGGLARLYESAPVRNLLLRLPHVRIGSAEDSAIMQRINNAAAKNAPPPPAGSPPHGSPPGTPPVAPAIAPAAPAIAPAAPAVAPTPVAAPVAPAIAPAAPAVAPAPVAAPVAAAIAKRPLSPFASESIAPPGKPVPALKRVLSPFALNEPLPIPRPNPFATDGIIRKPPSPFASEGIAPPYAKDAAPVAPAAVRAEAAVQKANVAKVNALTDSQARYVARSLGFGHMPEHLKEVLKQTHPEDLAKALENVPAVVKAKPGPAVETPAAASMKLLPEVSESSARAAENKRLVMEAKAKKASPAGAEAIQLPATETPLAKFENARASKAAELKALVEMAAARKAEAKSKAPAVKQVELAAETGAKPLEPWEMTRKEWNNHNFDENIHRDLPSDYFSNYEFNAKKSSTTLAKKMPSGIEIRSHNDPSMHGILFAFDGDKNVGMGDGKAFVVKPDYQKQGIGSELMKLTYAGKSIGSRTSAGYSLVSSFHKKEVATAISEGKPVPAKVLADYPDIKPVAATSGKTVAGIASSSDIVSIERNISNLEYRMQQDKASGKLRPENVQRLAELRAQLKSANLPSSPAASKPAGIDATAKPLPERTYDTMSDAIALSSPSGKMSKTSRDAAEKRLGEKLFGEGGMPAPSHPQPLEQVSLRRQAAELDRLAEGGMKPKAFRQDAENLRKRADALDNAAGIEATARPFDHGELNLPLSKRGITDAQIDRHLKVQRQEAEQSIREGRAQSAVDKKAAKELNLKYGDQLASRTALKHGLDKKAVVEHINRLVLDNPTEALKLLERETAKAPAVEAAAKAPASKATVVEAQAAKPVEQMTAEDHAKIYQVVKSDAVLDGRSIINADNIPNMESISSSIDNAKILPGIREISMSDFTGLNGKHYSVEGQKRINKLAEQIKASGEITPLIVVRDGEGSYILEGATRADALFKIGAKSFPAKVVLDLDSISEANIKFKSAASIEATAKAPAVGAETTKAEAQVKTVVKQHPDGTFSAKFIVPKDMMPEQIGGHQKKFLKTTPAGDYIIDDPGSTSETAHEASKDLLFSLRQAHAKFLTPYDQASSERVAAQIEQYKATVDPIVYAVKEQIQGRRNKQLAKIVADEGDKPAFWMDDQVHLESGIHGMTGHGEKYMTENGERAPKVFAKKIAEIVNSSGEGKIWGANKAAKNVAAKVHAEYKVNEAANAVKQKAVEEAKAVEQAEQAKIYNEKISLEGEKTIRSSSSANYNVGIRDAKDGLSVIESRIYTKESMPGVELLVWKASDGWRTAEKKTGMGVSGVATSSAKKALDKGFEAIRANGGSERIKKMIKSGDFKILNPETGIEATAQAPSVVIKGNK